MSPSVGQILAVADKKVGLAAQKGLQAGRKAAIIISEEANQVSEQIEKTAKTAIAKADAGKGFLPDGTAKKVDETLNNLGKAIKDFFQ